MAPGAVSWCLMVIPARCHMPSKMGRQLGSAQRKGAFPISMAEDRLESLMQKSEKLNVPLTVGTAAENADCIEGKLQFSLQQLHYFEFHSLGFVFIFFKDITSFIILPRLTLNFQPNCLSVLTTGITGMCIRHIL